MTKTAAKRKGRKAEPIVYIIIIVITAAFFLFNTFPFLEGVFYSFTDWKGYGDWNLWDGITIKICLLMKVFFILISLRLVSQ